MWLFGSNFFRPEPSTPHVSPSQINKLIETWGQESCRDEFLHEVSVGVKCLVQLSSDEADHF